MDLRRRKGHVALWGYLIPVALLFLLFLFDLRRSEKIRQEHEVEAAEAESFAFSRDSNEIVYIWKLYDLYEKDGSGLKARQEPRKEVSLGYELEWKQSAAWGTVTYLQASRDLFFQDQVFSAHARGSRFKIDLVSLGENYWRLSRDRRNWTKPRHFRVRPLFLPTAPVVRGPEAEMSSSRDSVGMPFWVENRNEFIGYVAFLSRDPDFPEDDSRIQWVPSSNPRVALRGSGVHYLKLRGVSRNFELTGYSETVALKWVSKPTPEAHPRQKDRALH